MAESIGERIEGTSGVALWEVQSEEDPWGPYLVNAIKVRKEGDRMNISWESLFSKANEFFLLGKNYIVTNGEITIIDESTGRMRLNSRWQNGLHEAVEAKERVYQENKKQREGVDMKTPIKISEQDRLLASITFQVFFRYYAKLAGMSVSEQNSKEQLMADGSAGNSVE